ncbi:MAG: hypothetical protein JO142_07165 [Burkholderiales bacterium]|nr:hypothetical protein [Burkholderiales bacterium]
MGKIRAGYLAASLMLCTAIQCGAADAKTVGVGVGVEDYRHFLPYSAFHDGMYGGLGKDMLDAFAKDRGYTFNDVVYALMVTISN